MAALSHFILCLGEKGLSFFKLLKASERFSWSNEADTAFEQLKLFLTKPPIMTMPRRDETLLIYIAATSRVVSTAIIVEHEEAGHAYKCNVRSTSSARSLMSPKLIILRSKSCYMPF